MFNRTCPHVKASCIYAWPIDPSLNDPPPILTTHDRWSPCPLRASLKTWPSTRTASTSTSTLLLLGKGYIYAKKYVILWRCVVLWPV